MARNRRAKSTSVFIPRQTKARLLNLIRQQGHDTKDTLIGGSVKRPTVIWPKLPVGIEAITSVTDNSLGKARGTFRLHHTTADTLEPAAIIRAGNGNKGGNTLANAARYRHHRRAA